MSAHAEHSSHQDPLVFACPQCGGTVVVQRSEVNCKIFRHGVFRATGEPVPPHASEAECSEWTKTESIWGCGKPFHLVPDSDTGALVAKTCGYI